MIADNFKYVCLAVWATYCITSVQCLSHQLQLQKVSWRLWLYNVFWMQTVASLGSGSYPQNPTNLRAELRKLKFVAKKYWHHVSRVESQGGKSDTGSKEEAALAFSCAQEQRSHCPGAALLHQVLYNKSALLSFSEQSHSMVCQKQNNFLESTGKYRRWESGSWGINVKKRKSDLCSYREHWSGNCT